MLVRTVMIDGIDVAVAMVVDGWVDGGGRVGGRGRWRTHKAWCARK